MKYLIVSLIALIAFCMPSKAGTVYMQLAAQSTDRSNARKNNATEFWVAGIINDWEEKNPAVVLVSVNVHVSNHGYVEGIWITYRRKDTIAADKLAADKLATNKATADKLAAEKVATDKQATNRTTTDKVVVNKTTGDKATTDKLEKK